MPPPEADCVRLQLSGSLLLSVFTEGRFSSAALSLKSIEEWFPGHWVENGYCNLQAFRNSKSAIYLNQFSSHFQVNDGKMFTTCSAQGEKLLRFWLAVIESLDRQQHNF